MVSLTEASHDQPHAGPGVRGGGGLAVLLRQRRLQRALHLRLHRGARRELRAQR